jgi:chemotaxis protein MotB
MKAPILVALFGLFLFPACSSTDDLANDKDRALNERAAENESLRKRRADDEAMRLVMAKELEQARADAAASQAERDRLARESEERLEAQRRAHEEQLASLAKRPVAPSTTPGLEVDRNTSGDVVMRLDHGVTFSSGSADLAEGGKKLLRGEVAKIIARYPNSILSIEGHTDDTPVTKSRWGNNLNLSIARALAVQEYLGQSVKLPKDRMRVVGYGDANPRIASKTADARAKNRRVEIVVLNSGAQ